MANDPSSTLQTLVELQEQPLSIIHLSEPLSATLATQSLTRTSDVSTSALDNPTPASLEADLTHYKVETLDTQFQCPNAEFFS